jgi:type I restriction enzyme S subunit
MNNWKQSNIGEVAEIKYGKDHKILNDGKYPLYGSGGIMRYVESFIYDKPSVLIPRKGSIENLFFTDKPFWSVDTLFWTKIDINKIDPRFFFYLLSCIKLSRFDEGSAIPSLTAKTLNEIVISYPESLKEQVEIRKVLEKIDFKIELLRQQNQTLEEMAQTLFKEWFVDFRFPGVGKTVDSEMGVIPEGWKVKGFLDLFTLLSGGTPKTSMEEYWNGKIRWISAKDVTPNHRKFILETEKSITQLGLEKSATKLLPEYTVVISARGTVGNYSILAEPMCISQSNYGVRAKDSKLNFYTYLVVGNQIETLKSQAYGSVFDTITTSTFKGLQIISPPKDILYLFEEVINPLFKKILNNSIQIQTLTQLRDRLLPKLMSGEVRVSNFNKNKDEHLN